MKRAWSLRTWLGLALALVVGAPALAGVAAWAAVTGPTANGLRKPQIAVATRAARCKCSEDMGGAFPDGGPAFTAGRIEDGRCGATLRVTPAPAVIA